MRKVLCLGLVVVFALMMTMPVFAAGSSFEFVAQHPIQTLPILVPDSSNYTLLYCEEFIPAGEYLVTAFLLSNDVVVEFDDVVTVCYTPQPEYDNVLGCIIESSCLYMGMQISFEIHLLYDSDSCMMVAFAFTEDSPVTVVPGDSIFLDPLTDSGVSDSSLRDSLVALFGSYEPQMETVTEVLPDGSSVTYERVIPDVAGLDYEWLASVGLFALVVFCFFRIVGGVAKQ